KNHLWEGILSVVPDDVTVAFVHYSHPAYQVKDMRPVRALRASGITGAVNHLGGAQLIGHDEKVIEIKRNHRTRVDLILRGTALVRRDAHRIGVPIVIGED